MSIEIESMNGNGSETIVNGVSNGDHHNGHHNNNSSHHEEPFNYDTVFPSLPAASTTNTPLMFNLENFKPLIGSHSSSSSAANNVSSNSNGASRRTLQTSIKFLVPLAERKKNVQFGGNNESKRRCEQIAKQHNLAKFEMFQAKDQNLHIVIAGSEEKALLEAKRAMLAELQIERDCKVKIPKEQHKFLIGKQGSVLKELQDKTATRIQVPKSDDVSNELVTISGPKEGIEQCIAEIRGIIDEQNRTGTERLNIPRLYHPWLRGFNNEIANEMSQRHGAKINIPPPHVEKDEITVSGDRDKVESAVAEINKIYAAKRKCNITKLAIQITKSQHRLIIGKSGANLHEIFKEHDVFVQVPKLDSDQETIYLYGEESKLGPALSQVCANANSIVTIRIDVPVWLHRHMIGEKGAHISKITADYPQTHVKFERDESKIMIEGPPDEVEKVKLVLEGITSALRETITCEEVPCDPKFFPMLVGAKKTENHVARLNKEYGVTVRVPSDPTSHPHVVRIEGQHDPVHRCKNEFIELLARLENERSKDIIIEQKFHSNLIGKDGKNLNEIRAKFNDVQIQIPSKAEKSDIVTIRGNKNDVDKCFKYLQQYVKDIAESNYQEEVQIVKEFHRLIIGKQGAFIKKIRDDTQTRIDIPSESSDSNCIHITGKQEQVRRAKKLIEDKVKELINIKEDFVDIPHQLHTALIGKNGNIIKHIRSECAGCIINFPPEASANDTRIVLKGSAEQIKKAKEELLKLAEQKHDSSYQEELNVKVEYHKFLVGRNGGRVNAIRDKYQVRIIFPNVSSTAHSNNNGDVDSNNNNASITIMGKKENVAKAREELEASIKSLEEQVTEELEVDIKWHKNFTSRRAKLINEISEENCNVKISFPKQGTPPPAGSLVKIVGPRDAVNAAKKRILDVVFEYENQVTIECHIPNKYHAMVIGKGGSNTRKISDEFKVDLKFQAKGSSQDANNSNDSSENNNSSHQGESSTSSSSAHETDQDGGVAVVAAAAAAVSKADTILISGLRENCEKAKQALLELVPISEQVPFPHKYHKDLLANKAEILRELTNNTQVQINVPKKEEAADYLVLNGQRDSLDEVKQALLAKLADIELNNFTVEITGFKAEFIPQLRGRNNQDIDKLEKKYKVRVELSKKGEQPDRVVLRGLQKNVQECEAVLRKRIEEEEAKVSQTIEIDQRVHSRLIGQGGKSRQKLMDKFHVDINFSSDRSSNQVVVKGKSAEQVEDACDHLKNLEEEYLADVIDKEQYVHPSTRGADSHHNKNGGGQNDKGFVVKGAPWEQNGGHNEFSMPDTSNMDTDFPTIGATTESVNGSGSSAWGPSKR